MKNDQVLQALFIAFFTVKLSILHPPMYIFYERRKIQWISIQKISYIKKSRKT